MKRLLLLAALIAASLQAVPQTSNGVIEGKVTRPNSEGISDVQITLVGPSPVVNASTLGSLYTPNPALTPGMRAEVDAIINSAPPGVNIEAIANAARGIEARLLGLPAPTANTLAAATPPPQSAVMTDREGHFSFRNLAPGRYQIRAQREGYFGAPLPGSPAVVPPTTVNLTTTVTAGQPTPPVAFTMTKGSIVSGRIRDPNGQPISGIQVSAFQVNYQNGRKVLQSANSKSTDDRGEYRIFWLPPGEYRIAAMPRRTAIAAPSAQDTYARTFFPNVVDAKTAEAVVAREGAELSGMDIVIRPDATGKISGQVTSAVTGPNGQRGTASTFYLITSDPKALTDTATNSMPNASPDRASGRFEIRGIVPGQYELMTNTPDSNGRAAWGRTRVNVGPGELENVTIDIHPGVEIKVRLSVDGATPPFTMQAPQTLRTLIADGQVIVNQAAAPSTPPVPTPTYRVQLRSAETLAFTPPFESAANQDITYDPSGVYLFRNVLEGKYTLNVQPLPANAYIADIKAGGTSALDSGFDINSQTGEIQVFVNTNGSKIQGVVHDSAQKPVASARIALVPPVARRQNIQLYKTSTSDASGNFTMNGVAPGEYKLFAWEAVPNNAWMNEDFLAPYEGRGQTVVVGAGASNIELKLIPKEADKN